GDYGVRPARDRRVHRLAPQADVADAGEGVDCDEHFRAVAVGEAHPFGQFPGREVQAGEVARVGLVAEAAIDGVGAGLDRRAQRRRGAGGADQFHTSGFRHGRLSMLAAGVAAARAKRRATSSPPRMPASANLPALPESPIMSAGVSSASSMALRSASTASVRPLIEMTRLKNSASPSSPPSSRESSVRIGPRMTTPHWPARSFAVTATVARSPSGTTIKAKPRSTGSI